jgi:tetratricopeptide (TPR) repeat protein
MKSRKKSSKTAVVHQPAAGRDTVFSPGQWWTRQPWLFGIFLYAATLLAYSPALHGGFLWDDETHISHNLALRTGQGLWGIWFQPGATFQYLQYYPLTFTVFWVEWHLWGLNTFGYHLVNVFFHATVALLLWQVLKRLNVRGAWLAGAIFALHPVCVMSVAWMTELKNTLSATLALLAGWAYLRAFRLGVYENQNEPAKLDWRFYLLSLALFQLALFAKTAVSFLPVTLLLITWWCGRRLTWRTVWPVLPMFAVAVGMGLLTFSVERSAAGGATGAGFNIPLVDRVLISGRSFWFYLGKLFVPYPPPFIYERWKVDAGVPWQWLFPAATVAALVAVWSLRGRIGKGVFVALAHFYVSTSLLILMLVLYMMRYSFVSDHWQYFGCMSVITVTAAGIVAALDRFGGRIPSLEPLVCGLLLFGLAALTWRQCHIYTDVQTLWQVTLERDPGSPIAHDNLGKLLLDAGQTEAAQKHFEAVLAVDPSDPVANFNLASIESKPVGAGVPASEAAEHYQRALAANPDDADTQENLGNALVQRGWVDEALPHLQRAAELQPKNAAAYHNNAYYNYANALMQKGRTAEAIEQYRQDLALNPHDAMGRGNLGGALLTAGRIDEGVEQYRLAVGLMTNNPMAHAAYGNALLQQGKLDVAVDEFESALAIQPDFSLARDRLLLIAWIWATATDDGYRNPILALQLAQDLQKSSGPDPAVLETLAAAYAEMDDYSKAISNATQALNLAMAKSQTDLAAKLREELAVYQSGRPYRDAALSNSLPNR